MIKIFVHILPYDMQPVEDLDYMVFSDINNNDKPLIKKIYWIIPAVAVVLLSGRIWRDLR